MYIGSQPILRLPRVIIALTIGQLKSEIVQFKQAHTQMTNNFLERSPNLYSNIAVLAMMGWTSLET